MLPTIEVTELTVEEITLETPRLAPIGLIALVRAAIDAHRAGRRLARRIGAARVAGCDQREGEQ